MTITFRNVHVRQLSFPQETESPSATCVAQQQWVKDTQVRKQDTRTGSFKLRWYLETASLCLPADTSARCQVGAIMLANGRFLKTNVSYFSRIAVLMFPTHSHTHTHTERERDRDRDRAQMETDKKRDGTHTHTHTLSLSLSPSLSLSLSLTHTHTHTHTHTLNQTQRARETHIERKGFRISALGASVS